ncbi:transcription termination/antitermination protein NusG [Treponema endosymbiont of Eucomonympha sp.]|uniref:transcription termination/antitermination protein NusG n=1 Tax=Treponema endosymbiont of Eucomonympha sp. TaxID=1580831 RepID=UPI000781E86A|nr:transcription termination/antitermination protein NusG [Treponema endosymbiont of Eucomonympha sp.]
MAKHWYILHTYTGYESKIEKTINSLIEKDKALSVIITDVKVPVEDVVEIKDGKKRLSQKKFLPGYMLIEMNLPDIEWKQICSSIRQIQGVVSFVGTNNNECPRPISTAEAKVLLQKSNKIRNERDVRLKQTFSVGEQVKIIEGAFTSFTGTIEEINLEKNKLRIIVGIFGRTAPVEVDILQVEKLW